MDVHKKKNELYGSNIELAAYEVNPEKANYLKKKYQRLWDEGAYCSFPVPFFNPEGDPDKALSDCAAELEGSLREVVEDAWFKSLARETALTICNVLCSSPLAMGTITICGVISYTPYTIAQMWNAAHPEETPIRPSDVDFR